MSLGARILIAVVACLSGGIMLLHGTTADPEHAWVSYVFGGFCISIAAASVLRGRAARFFGSVVGSCVFLMGLLYLGQEILGGPVFSGRRSQPSVFNALMFMIVFGIPGAVYAFNARFGFESDVPEQDIQPDDPASGDPAG
ncbi:hypothetical protein E4K72_21125 [Oxalobacteraceae bacterium OM1]|nr:hypothetical protein E4K72_21125 [Oxalobacteraceae bacterium OM1]